MIFDRPLVNQSLSASNWRVITGSVPAGIAPTAAIVAGGTFDRVRLSFAAGANVGAQSVDFAAMPPDVVAAGANGGPSPAFVFAIGP